MDRSIGSMVLALMCAAGAGADVTLLSRFSEARWVHTSPEYPGQAPPWTDLATYTEFGPWDVTLEHGSTHSDFATGEAIGGEFIGWTFRSARTWEWETDQRNSRMDVRFRNDAPRTVAIAFNAFCRPCVPTLGGSPNLEFSLTNAVTGEVLFEVFRDGTHRFDFPVYMTWYDQGWSASLPTGEFIVHVKTDYASFDQTGGFQMADGRVNFTMEFGAGCAADFNQDGFLDFFDYGAFVACFEGSCEGEASADFNADGFVDFFDYDAFTEAYQTGC